MEKIDSLIWNRRNKHVKEWGKSRAITKTKKKFYSRRYRKTTELIPPVAEDHQSNARRAYTHRNVTTTPYSRRGGFSTLKHMLDGLQAIFYIRELGQPIEIIFGLMI
ncbi:hypothetical protein RirG_177850 [Rhizophagus irregularis DAOM 197198w]|uniref:Uncharacterized protein n=2 Tax=Rhizophagus irregularis TaxID=588596 RepID=A0A015M1I2_RHIIW|nr:hypothetical protein RirG_177850 [Rhizophagus irregularis DAOM 197198w]